MPALGEGALTPQPRGPHRLGQVASVSGAGALSPATLVVRSTFESIGDGLSEQPPLAHTASPEGCKAEPAAPGQGWLQAQPPLGPGCAGGVGAPISLLAVLQGSAPRAARQGSEPGRRRAYHMSTEYVCENSRRPHLDRDGLKSKPWSVRRHCEPWQLGCVACHWFTRR
jgi:hypothetical protein